MTAKATDSEQLVAQLVVLWRQSAQGGSRMPSEPRLAEMLGASRNSVREALIRLEERGYIHRSQGSRTAINLRLGQVGTRVDEQRDHLQAIAAAGYRPRLHLAKVEVVHLDPGPTRFDDLPDGTLVLRTVKVWSADGVPYVMAEDLVPVRVPEHLAAEIDAHQPVFELAERLNGIRVAWETVWFAPTSLSEGEAHSLEISPATPATPAVEFVYCGVGVTDAAAYWCREIQIAAPERLRAVLVRRVSVA